MGGVSDEDEVVSDEEEVTDCCGKGTARIPSWITPVSPYAVHISKT